MQRNRIKILIVENYKDRFDSITKHLGKEFYEIDFANSIEDARKKIAEDKHHLMHINLDYQFNEKDCQKFRGFSVPMIIGLSNRSHQDLMSKIQEEVVSHDKIMQIDKDGHNYLSNLEWAIMNLFPQVFYWYRQRINESHRLGPKVIEKSNVLEGKYNRLNELEEDQKNIKELYISWRSLGEMIAIMIAVFAFAIGIIISMVKEVGAQQIVIHYYNISFIQLITIFMLFLILFSCMLSYFFNSMIKRKYEDKVNKMAKKWYDEAKQKKEEKMEEEIKKELSEKYPSKLVELIAKGIPAN